MYTQPNPKILGAFVIGFALVALAYLSTNFAKPTGQFAAPQTAIEAAPAPIRAAVAVTDADNNGIEDWRDELINLEPIVITDPDNSGDRGVYAAPDTVTGRFGVRFFERYLQSQVYGEFGGSETDIINQTIDELERETSVPIYNVDAITIIRDYADTDIVAYANAAGLALSQFERKNGVTELQILQDIMNRNDTSRFAEIEAIADQYEFLKLTLLGTPVPLNMAKEHLDLINTILAVESDVRALTLSFSDPAVTLLRIKRYSEDMQGLTLALENMYTVLLPYSSLFTVNDPGIIFSTYKPGNIGI